MNLGISGLASGFDWQSLVDQIVEVERAPQGQLRTDQTRILQRNEAYSSIKKQLQALQAKAQALKEASLFDSRTPTVSDSTVASATSGPGATQGAFVFNITHLASAAVLQGAPNLGARLHSADISATNPEPDTSPALGAVKQNAMLSSGNFTTAISDGGSGSGEFKINGVSISFSASTDGLANVMTRINDSNAGVIAAYDAVNDRLQLTNKNTGDSGVALEDVTGNFLAASGLTTGTLQRGKNLTYTVNEGGTLTSASNTITEESSGLAGLEVTALKAGTVTVQGGIDTAKIRKSIEDFVSEYNKTQSLIDTYTASSTDAKGKISAGVLAGEMDASDIARNLRGMLNSQASGLTGLIQRFDQIGYATNSNNDTVDLDNAGQLDAVIIQNLNSLEDFFSNETGGLASRLDQFIGRTIGDEGTLVKHQDVLTRHSAVIDIQVTDLERIVQMNQEKMTNSFIAMEEAQSRINQQLAYLQQQLGIS
jgi:flagellar hook-associated protein 2